MFPDVCEALSLGHLARGDATSAMVASEWYMRNQHFPGWGRPYEFASELFHKVRRLPHQELLLETGYVCRTSSSIDAIPVVEEGRSCAPLVALGEANEGAGAMQPSAPCLCGC